jgi:hypothetical protein
MRVPASGTPDNAAPARELICAQSCRVFYEATAAGGASAASWAPGESRPTTVFSGIGENVRSVLGARGADGRVWVSWTDGSTGRMYAKLGDSTGAGGTPVRLPVPPGFSTSGHGAAVTTGEALVIAANWQQAGGSSAVWTTVVDPPG